MADIARFVLDASVPVKWHLRDEDHVAQADAILRDFRAMRIRLTAPAHLPYEAASAIVNATRNPKRSNRPSIDEGRVSVRQIGLWGIELVHDRSLLNGGYLLAQHFGCSLYDGVYLALALSRNCPLIYADNRLRNALRGQFPLALWIEDYQPLG